MPESVSEKGLHPEPEAALALASDSRWELVNRIASSTPFRKSPRLRQFLLFVAERSLTGHVEDISEYEIGWKVFERGPNYNPVEDSIVRSAARQLRSKVKEYFETEGLAEDWIIEIPKGGYVPVFLKREHPVPPISLIDEKHLVEEKLAAEARLGADVRRWRMIAMGLAAGCVALAAVAATKSAGGTSAPRQRTIVSTVFAENDATRVVLGDFGLSYIAAASKRPITLAEYANRTYPVPNDGRPMERPLKEIWGGLTAGQIVYMQDANLAGSILQIGATEGKRVSIEHSRQLSAEDFRSGNLIVIASPLSSPWMYLFEDKLNFRYKIDFQNSFAGVPEFMNLKPQPGEQPSYPVESSSPRFGTTYAALARVPNLSGTGKVLLISGFRSAGAQAAREYATDPRAATHLAKLFGVDKVEDLPDFEVLLSSDSMASTPLNTKVAAYRRIN
jgi:hypothetical protein